MDVLEEARELRRQAASLTGRIERILDSSGPNRSPRIAGRVVNNGALPTDPSKFVALQRLSIEGAPQEGMQATVASPDDMFFAVPLVGAPPKLGSNVVACRGDYRWAIEGNPKVGTQGCPCHMIPATLQMFVAGTVETFNWGVSPLSGSMCAFDGLYPYITPTSIPFKLPPKAWWQTTVIPGIAAPGAGVLYIYNCTLIYATIFPRIVYTGTTIAPQCDYVYRFTWFGYLPEYPPAPPDGSTCSPFSVKTFWNFASGDIFFGGTLHEILGAHVDGVDGSQLIDINDPDNSSAIPVVGSIITL